MSRFKRFTPPSSAEPSGFTAVELLVALTVASVVITGTAAFIGGNSGLIRDRGLEIETNVTARMVADLLARDLRLGGACLPSTGEFVVLEGNDSGERDEIVTRTGITRDDLTCIRSATSENADEGDRRIDLEDPGGFEPGMRAYIRGTSGIGEFFTIETINVEHRYITSSSGLRRTYLATSGVYAVDERRYLIEEPEGEPPRLVMQIGDDEAVPFAKGIEKLDIEYQLRRNCPDCDVVSLPSDDEWPLVEQLFLTVTARSERPERDGEFYRRTLRLAVKPRNLLPQ